MAVVWRYRVTAAILGPFYFRPRPTLWTNSSSRLHAHPISDHFTCINDQNHTDSQSKLTDFCTPRSAPAHAGTGGKGSLKARAFWISNWPRYFIFGDVRPKLERQTAPLVYEVKILCLHAVGEIMDRNANLLEHVVFICQRNWLENLIHCQ